MRTRRAVSYLSAAWTDRIQADVRAAADIVDVTAVAAAHSGTAPADGYVRAAAASTVAGLHWVRTDLDRTSCAGVVVIVSPGIVETGGIGAAVAAVAETVTELSGRLTLRPWPARRDHEGGRRSGLGPSACGSSSPSLAADIHRDPSIGSVSGCRQKVQAMAEAIVGGMARRGAVNQSRPGSCVVLDTPKCTLRDRATSCCRRDVGPPNIWVVCRRATHLCDLTANAAVLGCVRERPRILGERPGD